MEELGIEETIPKKEHKIVVVGNGLDINLGLKTSYQHFIDYIKDRHHFSEDLELYEYNRLFLRKYEDFNLNWSDFESLYEETVRKVNNRAQHEDLQDSFEITGINDAITALEKDFYDYVSDEYQKWLQQNTVPQYGSEFKKFSKKVNPFIQKLMKDEDAFFINFNYTDTLEDLCEDIIYDGSEDKIQQSTKQVRQAKERIAHIHGSIEDENILFGGGFADREDTRRIHYSKSLLNDKLFRIKENDKLNTTRKNIMDELEKKKENFDLYIIGHSLQGSDFPFLSKMLLDAKRVFIFYYEADYSTKMEELIRELGSSIVEKIVLVPFLEILLENQLVIDSYVAYETIEPFLKNKFPKQEILEDLSLTARHFIFKHITELTITSENVETVLNLIEKLQENRIPIRIKKVCFSGTLKEEYLNRIKNSKAFMNLLSFIEKAYFKNTGIDIEFLENLFQDADNMTYMSIDHCTLLNNGLTELDISVCESLVRLEIIDSTFNPENKNENFIFNSAKLVNNIEKLVIEKNTNIFIENSILENAKNLLEVSIVFSDTDTYNIEAHLENVEILRIDCSTTNFPTVTVGNHIKEITITGYPDDRLQFSSLMKSDENSLGFPQFQLLQLNSPDNIRSFAELEIDVLLDVFSTNIKLIIDEESISIMEYYKKYKSVAVDPFLITTKEIMEKTFTSILKPEETLSQEIVTDFEEWYDELSTKLNHAQEGKEPILTLIREKLSHSKSPNKEIQKTTNEDAPKSDFDSLENNEQPIDYTKTEKLLFDYAEAKINSEAFTIFLRDENKSQVVIDIYKQILDLIEHQELTEAEIFQLKEQQFKRIRAEIFNQFSEKWFVSNEDLMLSAVQYKKGMEPIPAIGSIIDSRDFNKYKKIHPDAKKFKYPQQMKQAWQKVLEEQIVPLNEELTYLM
ncbi:hypothetical protein A5819_002545 [Enterococcus sp. 7E2_DIV0204]|uniref:AbiH family protein n=1 Tax=unclassified Enterococcus TaxID=2608891 RepID=UPI000A34F8D2|nr:MULTISPECIES: AbiH family protein [unclassified Enterococcus]OTN90046.1 hypothetical protein A5819_002545 [Enterococcus sp. 7E2_DIV0204]OTP52501.1 hypothetical protein A5884_001703 [Enterococcus sp. 7D2_DIV0200]